MFISRLSLQEQHREYAIIVRFRQPVSLELDSRQVSASPPITQLKQAVHHLDLYEMGSELTLGFFKSRGLS